MEPNRLKMILEDYEAYLQAEKQMAAPSIHQYVQAVRRFLGLARARPEALLLPPKWDWPQMDRRALEIHLNHLREQGFKPISVPLHIAALRNFFAWLHQQGFIRKSPARNLSSNYKVQTPAAPQGEAQTVAQMLMEAAPHRRPLAQSRIRLVLATLYGSMLPPRKVFHIQGLTQTQDQCALILADGDEKSFTVGETWGRLIDAYTTARSATLEALGLPTPPGEHPFWVDETGKAVSPERLGRHVRQEMTAAGLSGGATALAKLGGVHFRQNGGDVRSLQQLMGYKRLGSLDGMPKPAFKALQAQFNQFHPRHKPR